MRLIYKTTHAYSLKVQDINELLDVADRANLVICTSATSNTATEDYIPLSESELRRQWLHLCLLAEDGGVGRTAVNAAWSGHYLKEIGSDFRHHEGRVNGVAGNIYVERSFASKERPFSFEIRGHGVGTTMSKEARHMLAALEV